MNTYTKSLIAALITVIFLPNVSLASKPISAGILTDAQLLTLKRQVAKERQNINLNSYIDLDEGREDAFDENNRDCGNIEIGNVESGPIGRPVQQPVGVVVVGDIINLAEDC